MNIEGGITVEPKLFQALKLCCTWELNSLFLDKQSTYTIYLIFWFGFDEVEYGSELVSYAAHFAENQSLCVLAPAPYYKLTYKRSWHTGHSSQLVSTPIVTITTNQTHNKRGDQSYKLV